MHTFTPKPKVTPLAAHAKSIKPSRVFFSQNHEANAFFHLRRMTGSQAAQRLLQPKTRDPEEDVLTRITHPLTHNSRPVPVFADSLPRIQPKLTVSTPNDMYEREADRIAEQVMRMAEPQMQRACSCGGECSECRTGQARREHEYPQIMRIGQRDVEQSGVSPITNEVLRSPGRPLDLSARSYFEPRSGGGFSHVPVHGDRQSDLPGIHATGGQPHHDRLQRTPDQSETDQDADQRICGPDITTSLTTMLGTVEPWFRGLTGFQRSRSCMGLGPFGFLAGVNPIMAWDTRELFLPNTGWLDAYFHRRSCGSPRDAGCATDPTRHLCETAGSCGNSVLIDGKCLLAGTANYALFGKMCRLCHDYTGRWNRWDMRAIIDGWKTIDWDDSTPPKEIASTAYDGTFPSMPAAAENRGSCIGRCGLTHGGAFDFIWEPYRPR